ncbi:DUF5946 family protein [Blastococcus sp. SYSU D00820]
MPASPTAQPSAAPATRCPGCGTVLASTGAVAAPAGASAECARLFEETMRGLREEAGTDPRATATAALADDAYAAQHPDPAAAERLQAALDRLAGLLGGGAALDPAGPRPQVWQITPADVAADLDVIDLHVLVEAWARAVAADWARAAQGPSRPSSSTQR